MMEVASKAEMALEMAVDDASPDGGGSRRPGNLWTVEAREDMFRRREAGETWETICQVSSRRCPNLSSALSSLQTAYECRSLHATGVRCHVKILVSLRQRLPQKITESLLNNRN